MAKWAFDWNKERVAELRNLVEAGMSANQIAVTMGVSSRSAVIGKTHRLGLQLKGVQGRISNSPISAAEKKSAAPRCNQSIKAKIKRLERGAKAQPAVERPTEPLLSHAVGILDLKSNHCRAPLDRNGADGFAVFCGGETMEGKSYCAFHMRLYYVRPQPKPKRASASEHADPRSSVAHELLRAESRMEAWA